MDFKYNKFSNGLVLIGEINPSSKSAAVGFFVKTGSRDETPQINGVSHFLEHMLFKGTETLSAFEVNEMFDRTGAQFNAGTNEENTIYYAAVLPEYLVKVTELWAQLMRPALRNEDFNIEKNVIKEEIAMYKDTPSFDVIDRCRTLHFDNHPCGNSILGSEESIDNLTATQMRDYFNRRYAPNNMVLACAGNFDWDRVCVVVSDYCSQWQEKKVERELQPGTGSNKKERIVKENLVRERICLMSAGVPAQDSKRFAASLLSMIIGDDVGSRYFWELVDKALAEAASMQFSAMDGTGAFYSYLRCSSENFKKVLDTVNGIFQNLLKDGVTEEELIKAKNKVLSALVLKNELPMGRLDNIGSNWVYLRQYRSIEDEMNAIKDVSIDDINSLAEELKIGNFTQLSIGPDHNSQ